MSKPVMMQAIEWLWMFHKTYRKSREFLAEHAASSKLARSGTLTKDHPCYDQVIGVWNERNILLNIVKANIDASAQPDRMGTCLNIESERVMTVHNILVEVLDKLMAMFPMDQAPGEIQEKKP